MNTIELQSSVEQVDIETIGKPYPVSKKIEAFVKSQKDKRLGWFMIGLLSQAVLILPIPAVLIYYYNASEYILAVTLVLFFANVIAGMGGSKIGVLIFLVALNIVVHAAMICGIVLWQ